MDVVPIAGQAPGGSIVGISPGIALGGGGGSIVGITPGAALERKSVRDLAAGLNRLGGKKMLYFFRIYFLSHFIFLFTFITLLF